MTSVTRSSEQISVLKSWAASNFTRFWIGESPQLGSGRSRARRRGPPENIGAEPQTVRAAWPAGGDTSRSHVSHHVISSEDYSVKLDSIEMEVLRLQGSWQLSPSLTTWLSVSYMWQFCCIYGRYLNQISLSKSNRNAKMDISWLHNSLQSSSDAVLSIHIFMLGWHWVRVSWEMHSSQFPWLTNTFQTSKNPKIRQSGIIQRIPLLPLLANIA